MNLTGMSIFATMSQLCRDNNAINLSQGCPDFDCDPELTELLTQAMKNGYNQYSPMEGILPLREGISEKYYNLYNVKYHPVTDITITAGATEAVFVAISSVVKKGDEVIVFEPAFDSYVPVIKLAGGIPVPVSLEYPDYKINWETVKNHISNKTKLIIINSPHNPTGTLLNSNDFAQLSKIVDENDIYILSDEVYEHIIFDGHQHESLALHPTLIPKSFIVGSFGKTFHTTGWQMGYCIAPPALSFEFRKVHQYVTFSAFTPAQYAIAEYIKNKDHYLQLPRFYEQKRNFFLFLCFFFF